MKHLRPRTQLWVRSLVPVILGFGLLAGQVLAAIESLAPLAEYPRQCVAIVKALEKEHYTGKKMDQAMSAQVFEQYIKNLDPMRQLLTLKDMAEFEPIRHLIHRSVKKGDLGPAYEIFNRYQARSEMRLAYILELARDWKTQMDFTQDETLVIDQKARELVQDLKALYPVWKKELKNHIISLKLDKKTDEEISEILEKTYKNRLDRLSQTHSRDVFQLFMNSITACFDPHTQYFPPRVSEDFDIHMSLSLEGIGAVLQNEYEYTKVVRLIPKGPADKSHLLMPGDKIIGVGQGMEGEIKDTIGQRIDDVVKLIRGPKDTYVRLKIIPAKNANATATINIKRDKVKLEEQEAKKQVVTLISDGRTYKIGIIEIPNFYIDFAAYHRGDKNYKSTTMDVAALLAQLKEEKIDGLIMDLRDNGGGSLKEANDLTGLFLTSGPTVQIKTKNNISRLYDQDPSITYTGPLVVLINRMSASASEIFAGAIKDYNRGIILGTQSFGKGTVQELKPLGEGKIKVTSAKFYRVSGQSTQHRGVIPDIEFPKIYRTEETGESALEGALLWDQIPATRYSPYPFMNQILSELAQDHAQRAENAPGMVYLKKRIDMAADMGRQQTLTLNLEKRRQLDQELTQKELALENIYLTQKGEPPLETLKESGQTLKEFNDILMAHTQYLTAEFIRLSQDLGYHW